MASGSILRLQDGRQFQLDDSFHGFRMICCATMTPDTTQPQCKKKWKPGRISHGQPVFKYGVEVPKNTKHAEELDTQHGNTLWKEAYQKEIVSLLSLGCFDFCPPDSKPGPDYQFVKLTMIYEVKQDGRCKARLVVGSHLVDPCSISTHSTMVKGASVRLLDVIGHRDSLKVLCGGVSNAFVTALCLEKVCSRTGPDFGDCHDSIMVLTKALYGLRSLSHAFRGHFADFLHSMGFHSVHYDHDVWMQLCEDKTGYDYICTHVDDFKIVARDPSHWLTQISGVFLLKSTGPPSYYLGNDYVWSTSENAWVLGCSTYIKECIYHLEEDDMIEGRLWEHKNPLPAKVHPEMDESPLLDDQGLKLYQTLIGMAQWACTISHLDISFAMSSLSRFSTAPHVGHLQLAIYMFGYLKKHPNCNLVIDSGPLIVPEEFKSSTFCLDFLEDYPDAQEELDPIPEAFGQELETSIFFMRIMHTTRRHADPFPGSSSSLAAPQFFGPAIAKVALPLPPTVRSLLRCTKQ